MASLCWRHNEIHVKIEYFWQNHRLNSIRASLQHNYVINILLSFIIIRWYHNLRNEKNGGYQSSIIILTIQWNHQLRIWRSDIDLSHQSIFYNKKFYKSPCIFKWIYFRWHCMEKQSKERALHGKSIARKWHWKKDNAKSGHCMKRTMQRTNSASKWQCKERTLQVTEAFPRTQYLIYTVCIIYNIYCFSLLLLNYYSPPYTTSLH